MLTDSLPVLLSLGANLGDRLLALRQAIEHMAKDALLHNIRVSSVYETEPVGYKEQPAFLNLCVSGITTLSPLELRRALSSIESTLGRTPRAQWHEREIDIDILLVGKEVLLSEELTLPHPRMHERAFVLVPAAEIAAEMLHPLLQKSIGEIRDSCTDTATVRYYTPFPHQDAM